ncbi:MAG: M3 family oligoendopeptidase [Erysipelotrichaceae bacterium]|nr:M3 family oligoendopeptidase [Erysipelotrichaceae bacterium]
MKFSEYAYHRPDYEAFKKEMQRLIQSFKNAKSSVEQYACFEQIMTQQRHLSTMATLSSIRFSINTLDPFYVQENEYWDQQMPLYQQLNHEFQQALLQSPYLEELKQQIPAVYFQLLEYSMKSFDPSIIEELQEENRLTSEYSKLIAQAEVEFDGKTYNLPQLKALTLHNDREFRKRAYDTRMSYFTEHETEFDTIYDQLVHVRDRMAKKMGYENYVELGYYRMNRLDYDETMVANYRKQILEEIVPIANQLYQRQQKRLGYDTLHYYDESFEFTDGNAKPQGSYEEILANGNQMYHELSKETGEFFDYMMEHELLDLVAKKGKDSGGYCTYIEDYQSPFIFSNFNGTSGDIDVLTHEAGHAFQSYQSRWISIPDLNFPTMESCEIHSMSMEFITWPWMELFFKDQADKYRFSHLSSAITFLPYGVLVDHFQHEVYHHVEWDAQQRKACWRTLEKQYLPHKNYEGCDLLERGGWWFQQGHIFASPFYYIDYTLAQVCALQFFKRFDQKDPTAWPDYLHLCQLGGTKSFTELVKEANLTVPFTDGCIHEIATYIANWLNQVDDTKL